MNNNYWIREYKKNDLKELITLINDLRDHVVLVDSDWGLSRRPPLYGKIFAKKMVYLMENNNAKIIVADSKEGLIGFSVGNIIKQTKEDLLKFKPFKIGRIEMIFVKELYRKRNIGSMMVQAIEKYFKSKGCDFIKVGSYASNRISTKFYKNLHYKEYTIDFIKKI